MHKILLMVYLLPLFLSGKKLKKELLTIIGMVNDYQLSFEMPVCAGIRLKLVPGSKRKLFTLAAQFVKPVYIEKIN